MTDQHTAEQLADHLELFAAVEAVDVLEDPALTTVIVEATLASDRIGSRICEAIASHDCAIDPDRSATRGDPTHTVVVAR